VLEIGDTFLLPKSSEDTEHLWVVLTKPDAKGRPVCANITTAHSYSERTVVLQAGEHPFIKHESVVMFADARILDLNVVQKALDYKQTTYVASTHKKCSVGLLKKIQDGLLRSKQASNDVKDFFREMSGV
jgi:hypothetical protein